MTKAIIRDHLLISGRHRREDVLSLERRCRQKGFSIERTGQFGVGVLSYFMLADRVIIRTRRSADAGSSEPHGWRFETDGIDSFGQLEADTAWTRGTQVQMRLRALDTAQSLPEYLSRLLVYLPCKFHFSAFNGCRIPIPVRSDLPSDLPSPGAAQELPAGWVVPDEDFVERCLIADLTSMPALLRDFHPRSFRRRLRVVRMTGTLPSGVGRFRMLLPYFSLPGGDCLGYLNVDPKQHGGLDVHAIGDAEVYCPVDSLQHEMSWNGMKVENKADDRRTALNPPVFTQIDWTSNEAGKISVNRTAIGLTKNARIDLVWVEEQRRALVDKFLQGHKASAFADLNQRISGRKLVRPPSHWLSTRGPWGPAGVWQRVTLPAVFLLNPWLTRQRGVSWAGQSVPSLGILRRLVRDDQLTPMDRLTPDRLLASSGPEPLCVGALLVKNCRHGTLANEPVCLFPPTWENICRVDFNYGRNRYEMASLLNADHPLVQAAVREEKNWTVMRRQPDTRKVGESPRHGPAAALLTMLHVNKLEQWHHLTREQTDVVQIAWLQVFGNSQSVFVLVLTPEQTGVIEFTPSGPKINVDRETLYHCLPDPGPDWRFELKPGPPSEGELKRQEFLRRQSAEKKGS